MTALIHVFHALSLARTDHVYAPLYILFMVYVVDKVSGEEMIPLRYNVYPDILASNHVHVKGMFTGPVVIAAPLAGMFAVTEGGIISIVNVVQVVVPRILERRNTYFPSPVIGVQLV
jgi:hypothetical protein